MNFSPTLFKFASLLLTLSLSQQVFALESVESVLDKFNTIHTKVNSDEFTFENCESFLNATSSDYAILNPTDLERDKLESKGFEMISVLWKTRTSIRNKLTQFYMNAQHSEACSVATRNTIRTIRAVEDYLGYLVHSSKSVADSKGEKYPHPSFVKSQSRDAVVNYPEETLINPNYRVAQLRSGDLLLSRGTVFSSAAIARMADQDAQFSHQAFVYIDPITKKKYTVEAHIEIGSVVIPFEEYFKDGKVRSVVYRYHDPKVAHEAASLMFHRVQENMLKKKNVPYDFKMLSDDHSELFCSETSRAGFEVATDGQVSVPLYMSRFTMKNKSLLNRLGSNADAASMPGDIEGDPRFELIAEWRNFNAMRLSWTYDAMLTKMFEWMEKFNYKIHDTFKGNFGKRLIYGGRRVPIFNLLLKKKVPLNMSRSVLSTMIVLDSVTSHLMDGIEIRDEAHVKKTGYPQTIVQIMDDLEAVRAANPNIHKGFRIDKP